MENNEQKKPFLSTIKGLIIFTIIGSLFFICLVSGKLWAKTVNEVIISMLCIFIAVIAGSFIYKAAKDKSFKWKKSLLLSPVIAAVYVAVISLASSVVNIFTATLVLAAGLFAFAVYYGALFREKPEIRMSFALGLLLATIIIVLFFPDIIGIQL